MVHHRTSFFPLSVDISPIEKLSGCSCVKSDCSRVICSEVDCTLAKCRRACDLCFVLIILDTREMALVSLQINGNMFIRFLHVPPETKAYLCIILPYVLVYSLKID